MTTGALYPESFVGLNEWANEHGVSIEDARIRYVQYAILAAIASQPDLSGNLIMKGGVALDFVWMPYRSTSDIDFSVNPNFPVESISKELLSEWLVPALQSSELHTGVLLALNGVDQDPNSSESTFVTFTARIAHALPDQIKLRNRMQLGKAGTQVVSVDISINEPVCDYASHRFGEQGHLLVSTVEDIVAEKLRAILQQPIRNRSRSRDVLDIANLVSASDSPDRNRIGAYLAEKASARGIAVSKARFRALEIRERSKRDYDVLFQTVRNSYLEFDEAFARLLEFVDSLPIPEE